MVNLYFPGPLVGFQPETMGGTGEAHELETSNFLPDQGNQGCTKACPEDCRRNAKNGLFPAGNQSALGCKDSSAASLGLPIIFDSLQSGTLLFRHPISFSPKNRTLKQIRFNYSKM